MFEIWIKPWRWRNTGSKFTQWTTFYRYCMPSKSWPIFSNNYLKWAKTTWTHSMAICFLLKVWNFIHPLIALNRHILHQEENFFIEAEPGLQLWCNALNEYILDSTVPPDLSSILNKSLALYSTGDSGTRADSETMFDSDDEESLYVESGPCNDWHLRNRPKI